MYLLVVWIGVWFWCTMCADSISMRYAAAGFLFALCVECNVVTNKDKMINTLERYYIY